MPRQTLPIRNPVKTETTKSPVMADRIEFRPLDRPTLMESRDGIVAGVESE
jgi:hypothetical protein